MSACDVLRNGTDFVARQDGRECFVRIEEFADTWDVFFLTLPALFRIIESIMPDELPPPGAIVARRPCGHLVG